MVECVLCHLSAQRSPGEKRCGRCHRASRRCRSAPRHSGRASWLVTARAVVTPKTYANAVRPRFRAANLVGTARRVAMEMPTSQDVQSPHGGRRLDEIADAEMSHVRDRFGTVIVPEFRRGFLAGIHPGDTGAAGVMGRPLGNVVDFP